MPKPPSFAPQKLQNVRKPRSRTVGTESLTASLECTLSERRPEKVDEQPNFMTQSVTVNSSSPVLPPNKPKGPLPKVPPQPPAKGEQGWVNQV
jgi:hypothetical protein